MSDGDVPGPYRVDNDPVEPTAEPVGEIVVDGTPVPFRPGETVAAALLASGRVGWAGGYGSVFCGTGVCYGCLVRVGEVDDIRACRYVARPGDTIRTARPGGDTAGTARHGGTR